MSIDFSLTKCLDPTDYVELIPELVEVDKQPLHPDQHTHRRWEYAMALRAHSDWRRVLGHHPVIMNPLALDIGGGGSYLSTMMDRRGLNCHIIDPTVNFGLEKVAAKKPPIRASIITCTSTIEHVENLEDFLIHLDSVVAPRGLLFLTSDIWGKPSETPDTAHFHWMRKRIFTPETWEHVAKAFAEQFKYRLLGGVDWSYKGDQVYDYSFCSLAMTKG